MWNNLSDLDRREIASYYTANEEIHSDIRQETLAKKYGVTKRTIRNWLNRLGVTYGSFDRGIDEHPQYLQALDRRLNRSNIYFITYEQNKTPVHDKLWENMNKYAKFLGAEIIVIQGRYQNPTSIWRDRISNEGWSTVTNENQFASRLKLHPYLQVVGEAKVLPTAINPLTGFETLTGLDSGIIAHPKMHFSTLPRPKGYRLKALATTGAITIPNYTESKAGIRAEKMHKLGFLIVEIKDDEVFYLRQVEADEQGNFYDLFFKVEDLQISKISNTLGMVLGDTHYPYHDKEVHEMVLEVMSILNPEKVVWHDIWDGESVNRHMVKSPIERYHRWKNKRSNIVKELGELVEFLNSHSKEIDHFVSRSNHEIWLETYVNSQDWTKDIENSDFYIDSVRALMNGEVEKGLLEYWTNRLGLGEQFKFLGEDDSLRIGKYECSMHGHRGNSGSRGSFNQFHRLGFPNITAHGHSTLRKDDSFRVGTLSKMSLGYNVGITDWSQSISIIHLNGVAQQILFIEGGYTTLKELL